MNAEIEITIDPEFRDLLPAHSADEAVAFRDAVERDGKFTDNLIVWREKGKLLLLDGHRRFDLWCSLPDDTIIEPPNVDEISLPDRHAAKLWMLRRQLGRRNLTETQAAVFRGRLYNERKADPTDNLKVGTAKPAPEKSPKCHSDTSGKQGINGTSVAEEVAAETNASVSTIKRDGAFVEALDAIGQVNPKAKADIEAGDMKLAKKDVIAIGKLDRDGIAAALKNVRFGKPWDEPKEDKRTSFDVAKIDGEKAAIVKDELERDVPKALIEKHAAAAAIKAAASKLDAVKKLVRELSESAGGEFLPVQQIEIALKDAKGLIAHSRYWTSCPRTHGKGKCDRCDGHGYIPFSRRGMLSDDDKKSLGVE